VGTQPELSRWELAAEAIAVKIRWFGTLFGYLLVNFGSAAESRPVLNALLALGVLYTLCDTAYSLRGRVLFHRWPLLISLMESLFIALLCYFDAGLESAFRNYYILSLICCAIRYSPGTTYATFALHSISYLLLFLALPHGDGRSLATLVLTLVILGWVTWASAALARLLKRVGDHLSDLNRALEENRGRLEERIAERTRELQESQAHVLHQEKMAGFGLLAAGIAHEVGNPLTAISSLVQMLQRRDQDETTRDKLTLISGQLQRIQNTLRELVNFSRPVSTVRTRVQPAEALSEALHIAKYYLRIKGRRIDNQVPHDMPVVLGVRDQLVQVFLNLILNAIDATAAGGSIILQAVGDGPWLDIRIQDSGTGIAPEDAGRLFQPYFTTKKQGTGLGLFVTRKLVGDHGGTIDFETTPGAGTTFHVRLPAIMERPHEERRSPAGALEETPGC
jgi:two-component system NtrC family sensor kinase